MTDTIAPFPGVFHRKREITAREIWDAPQPSDLMAWEVCAYLRMTKDIDDWRCKGCPRWRHEPAVAPYSEDGDDRVQDGCRMMAEEVCRVVMAIQKREAGTS